MDSLLRDVRHAARNLARTPGFALVTILTLALGIGANTAIFSVVNAVILRPLGYPQPDRLIYISSQFPQMGFDQFWVSPPEFLEFQERTRAFSVVGAFTTGQANLTAADRPRRVNSGQASATLFKALGVSPMYGRTFEPGETLPNGPRVIVLTHELWRSAFGGSAGVLNSEVEVNGLRRTVVGIMPPHFDVADQHVELWAPLQIDPANRRNRGSHFLYLIGRLADGATLASAQAELDTLLAGWRSTIAAPAGATNGPHTPDTKNHRLRLDPLQLQIVGSARTAVFVLQGAVIFVLLIACANLANLLLARAESRHKEFAVRSALGAGRWRLLRQFMVEGCLLSFSGAALGLGVAVVGVRALDRGLSAEPAAIGGRRARSRRARVYSRHRAGDRRRVRARAAAASCAGCHVTGAEGRRHEDDGRRWTQPDPPRAGRGGGGAGRGAGHRRGAAAADGHEPVERRFGLQARPARHLRRHAAERDLREARAGARILRPPARAAALDRRRAERRRDDRAAAAATGERERHDD